MMFLVRKIYLYIKLFWHYLVFYTFPTLEESYYTNLGAIYFELEQYNKAISKFRKSEESHFGKDRSFTRYNTYHLGYSYLNLGNHQKAVRYFEEYLSLAPEDIEIISFVGWCYLLLHNYESALNIYLRLIELEPSLPTYRIECAKIFFELDRKDDGYKQLCFAKRCSNDLALGQVVDSLKYRIDGDLGNAIAALKSAIKNIRSSKNNLYPQLEDLYILLSEYQKENSDLNGAISTLEELYKINSKDLWNINCLAFEYADQNINLEKALKLANRCLKYQPENSFFIDTKSWILFKLGRVDSAKNFIGKSLKLNPNSKDAQEHFRIITGDKVE